MKSINIKTKIYEILNNDLKIPTTDSSNSLAKRVYPSARIALINEASDSFRDLSQTMVSFQIDIFSDYNGEKEILDIKDNLYQKIKALYDEEEIMYIRQSSIKILDDKATGVIRKHGIITYTFLICGSPNQEEE